MPDEPTSDETQAQEPEVAAPDSPPAEGERVFTQAEVGKMLAAERKRLREAALKDAQQQKQAPKQEPDAQESRRVPTAELQRQLDMLMASQQKLELELAFSRTVRKYQLSEEQVGTLQAMALAIKPGDLGEWLEDTVSALGLGKPQPGNANGATTKPAQTTEPTARAQREPPASDRGGPSRTSDGMLGDNPLRWTEQDVRRVIDGEKSYMEGVQKVREQFMRGLRGVSIEFPRGPK